MLFIHSVVTDLPPTAFLGVGAWLCCTFSLGLWVPSGTAGLGCSFLTAVVLADALEDHGDRAVLTVPAATACSSSFVTSLWGSLEGHRVWIPATAPPACSCSSKTVPGHQTMALFLPVTAGPLIFCQAVRAAPCVEKLAGLCAVCVMESQGPITAWEGTFPG